MFARFSLLLVLLFSVLRATVPEVDKTIDDINSPRLLLADNEATYTVWNIGSKVYARKRVSDVSVWYDSIDYGLNRPVKVADGLIDNGYIVLTGTIDYPTGNDTMFIQKINCSTGISSIRVGHDSYYYPSSSGLFITTATTPGEYAILCQAVPSSIERLEIWVTRNSGTKISSQTDMDCINYDNGYGFARSGNNYLILTKNGHLRSYSSLSDLRWIDTIPSFNKNYTKMATVNDTPVVYFTTQNNNQLLMVRYSNSFTAETKPTRTTTIIHEGNTSILVNQKQTRNGSYVLMYPSNGANGILFRLIGSTVAWEKELPYPPFNSSMILDGSVRIALSDKQIHLSKEPQEMTMVSFNTSITYEQVTTFTAKAATPTGLSPIIYASSNPAVATINNEGTVTVISAGISILNASQAGDNDYAIGTISRTLTVNKAIVPVALSGLTFLYNGTARAATVTCTKSTLVTYNGSSTLPINAGTYAVVASVMDNNYQGTVSDALVILPDSDLDGITDADDPYPQDARPAQVIIDSLYQDSITRAKALDASVAPVVGLIGDYSIIESGTEKDVRYSAKDNIGIVSRVISYSPDSGTTWIVIDSGIKEPDTTYRWSVPAPVHQGMLQVTAYDAQGKKGMASKHVCIIGKPSLKSKDSVTVMGTEDFGYRIVYDFPGNPMATIQVSKPSWLQIVKDSLFGIAPSHGLDTIQIVISAGPVIDTFKVIVRAVKPPSTGVVVKEGLQDYFGLKGLNYGVNAGSYSIVIYDLSGRLIYQKSAVAFHGFIRPLPINRSGFQLVRLVQGSRTEFHKLLITK